MTMLAGNLSHDYENDELSIEEEHDRDAAIAYTRYELVKHPALFKELLADKFENDYADVIAALYADPAEALHTLQKWVDELTQAKAEQMVLEGEAFDTLRVEEHEDYYVKTLEECAQKWALEAEMYLPNLPWRTRYLINGIDYTWEIMNNIEPPNLRFFEIEVIEL